MNAATYLAFVHGGGQGGWVWEKTISALHARSPRISALALDVPGCGKKRARNTALLDNTSVAIDLLQDIEHAGAHDIVLVGHSQAGQVLPFIAASRPELFRHLVYVTCSLPSPGQTVIEMMGTAHHGEHENEPGIAEIGKHFASMFCNDMTGDQSATFLAALGHDRWPMKTYEFTDWPTQPPPVPATYILCERDSILPPEWQVRFATRLGSSKIIRVDAGHQVMVTRPDDLADILLRIANA